MIQDVAGKAHRALVFPVALNAGAVSTQEVAARGIPVGKDYAVVIEALSKDNPPRLLGSSCNKVLEIKSGQNPTLLAQTIVPYPTGPLACDPRFEK